MKSNAFPPPSVPSGKGEKVEHTITISRPPAEVFAFWRHLENLPRFLNHLASVVERDPKHSRWTARGPGGREVCWDAEIIEERKNEMLSWRSLRGSEVDNAGSVWFNPTADGRGTVLKVSLKYAPPAGKIDLTFSKLWHGDADSEIREDLARLKDMLERQDVPPSR